LAAPAGPVTGVTEDARARRLGAVRSPGRGDSVQDRLPGHVGPFARDVNVGGCCWCPPSQRWGTVSGRGCWRRPGCPGVLCSAN